MIVDYIDGAQDTDFEEWKMAYKKAGKSNKYPITAWVPQRPEDNVKLRTSCPIPDCKLDDVLGYITEPEKRIKLNLDVESIECLKEHPVSTKLLYMLHKT